MKYNNVKLVIENEETQCIIQGWTQLNITRGIERIPNTFSLMMTEKIPSMDYVVVQQGDKCKVYIDDDVVVTGYVDRCVNIINANQHIIQVIGRGKCSDLVDCAAVWKGMQFQNMKALDIATSLCEDYSIKVTSEVETKVISVQNINLGETVAAVLDRVCRVAQVLYYEDENGDLILSQERNDSVKGSLVQGVNIESATHTKSVDQLYSHYIVVNPSAPLNADQTQNTNAGYYIIHDAAIKRNRPLYIIPEDGDAGYEVAEKRAMWERNRRYARSNMLQVTVTGWRDISDVLYKPNTQVQVNIPSLKVVMQNWLIGEVSYRKDESGTRCDMLIMPIGAYTPEPIIPFKGLPTDVLNANLGVPQQ